mmetsp:Transcript_20319/g.25026  ORF Transcript_20319/g.25026 Transcript_20319/m.25026 type:complete len:211 (+) Transcript_20319:1788-2420(+)
MLEIPLALFLVLVSIDTSLVLGSVILLPLGVLGKVEKSPPGVFIADAMPPPGENRAYGFGDSQGNAFVGSNDIELRSALQKSFAKLVGVAPAFSPLRSIPIPFCRESGGDGKQGDKKIPGDPNCDKSKSNCLFLFREEIGDLTGVRALGTGDKLELFRFEVDEDMVLLLDDIMFVLFVVVEMTSLKLLERFSGLCISCVPCCCSDIDCCC